MENRSITKDEALKELARRELSRREQLRHISPMENEAPVNKENLGKLFGTQSTPFGNVKDILSGVATTGQNISNALTGNRSTQYNFSNENTNPFLEKGGEFLPATIAGGPSIIGQAIAQGLTGAANATPEEENALGFLPKGRVGAGIENALLSMIPTTVLKGARLAYKGFARPQAKELAAAVQLHPDELYKSATKDFEQVGKEVIRRNVDNVPIRKDLIADISEHFPDTKKYKDLLNKAYSGDYEGLRDLQADLWQKGTKALKSPLQAEQNAGEKMLDLRDEINDSISEHLKNTGNHDLYEVLQGAKNKYFKLKKLYFSKETPAAIKKLVHEDYRKMPANIFKTLSEESKPVNAIKEANPEIEKYLMNEKERENALKTLKRLGIGTAGLTGLGVLSYGGNALFNAIKNALNR